MEQIKTVSNVVTLVKIPRFLPVIMWPQIGEYSNPYILKTIPCEKADGKYIDLRTGEEVQKSENMLEWNNLTGSVFRYPDGHTLLISRRFDCKSLILCTIADEEIKLTTMMVRPVIVRDEKELT